MHQSLLLRAYIILVGMFLESCYGKFSNERIIKEEVKKATNNYLDDCKVINLDPCNDQGALSPKEKETKPKRIAIRKKRLTAQSTQISDRQVALVTTSVSKRRPVKRRARQRAAEVDKTAKQNLNLEKIAVFSSPSEQADENKQVIGITINSGARKNLQAPITEGVNTSQSASCCKVAELEVVEKENNVESATELIDVSVSSMIELLPVEILAAIFSYLLFEEMLLVREVNQFFYALTTGYNRVGVVGIANKPDSRKLVDSWCIGGYISLKSLKKSKKRQWNHERIPSFIFYQFMDDLLNFSTVYWSCLPSTHIRSLMIKKRKISVVQAEELGRYLVGSKVQKLILCMQLGDEGIEALSRHLSKTNVEIIDLEHNHIGPKGATALFKNLQGSKVREINLDSNKIGNEGLNQLGKCIGSIPIERLNLICNEIEFEGMQEFLDSLGKDTSLKLIYLCGNKLTEEEKDFLTWTYRHIKLNG